jgi:hypothetical protein
MVGGTRFPPRDSRASLGRHARKRKDFLRRKNKKRARKARTLYVSVDRADAFIEGGAALDLNSCFLLCDTTDERMIPLQ